ncbi:MAG: pentapeptide repeat-containing protein [Oscillospiraceae bacterium]|jgi:hypothetical protein|nr:pentapeptide repeat-containing protein [Oscillospiraceae bacterium]
MRSDIVLGALIAAIAGLVSASVGAFIAYLASKKTNQINRENAEADRQLKKDELKIKQDELNANQRDHLAVAIEHLGSEELTVRMGALLELQKLGVANKEDQPYIVRILSPFVRRGMEDQRLMRKLYSNPDYLRPDYDVAFALEIASLFFEQTESRVNLRYLNVNRPVKLDLRRFQFKGARLGYANLEEVRLKDADLEGADLWCANLNNIKQLTAEQLLKARFVDTAKFDPVLKAMWLALKEQQQQGEG